MYSRNTEVRQLSATDIYQLAQILDPVDSWKKLMAIIPKNFTFPKTLDTPRKYTSEQIRLVENASVKQNRAGAEILFDEWGTSGRKRPTVGNLLDLLVEAELFRAADHVAVKFLNEPVPDRPTKGPAAIVDTQLPFDIQDFKEVDSMMDKISYPGSSTLIQNNNESSDTINRDFYTKLGPDRQKVEVPISDMMKFSGTSISIGDLPDLSALGKSSTDNNQITIPVITQSCNTQSNNQDYTEHSQLYEERDNEMVESGDIPVSSAYHMHSIVSVNENNSELPNLSALNINVNTNVATTSTNTSRIATDTASEDGRDSHLNVPSPSRNLYDSDTNITPDLSILGLSSFDDSSLTNVTETSDDLSLDAGTRLNLSENNIPMLSDLHK